MVVRGKKTTMNMLEFTLKTYTNKSVSSVIPLYGKSSLKIVCSNANSLGEAFSFLLLVVGVFFWYLLGGGVGGGGWNGFRLCLLHVQSSCCSGRSEEKKE